MSNIVIDPSSGILEFNTGSANGSSFDNSLLGASRLEFQNSGQLALTSLSTGVSEKFTVDGPNGRLFTVDNEVTGSIFSVNDAAGLPIVEVFSDDRIIMGQYATDALVISGSSVGIGTDSPSRKFEIHENTTNLTIGEKSGYTPSVYGPVIETNANAITLPRDLYLAGSQVNVRNISSVLTLNGDNGIAFRYYDGSAGQEGMRLTNAGNFGIGTTSPSNFTGLTFSDPILDVAGPIQSRTGHIALGGISYRKAALFTSTGNDAPYLDFRVATSGTSSSTTARMRIDANGYVGIGTTSPAKELDVVGTVRANSSNGQYQLRATQLITYGVDAILNAQSGGDDVRLNTQSSTVLIATAEGNVGIGTTSPVAKFEVTDGSSSITLQEYSSGAAIFLDGVNGDFTGGDYFHILANSNSYLGLGGYGGGTTPLNISNDGKVGIGVTDPATRLYVKETGAANTAIFENSGQAYAYAAIKVAESQNNKAALSFAVGDALASTHIQAEIHGLVTNNGGALTGDLVFKTNQGDNLQERMRINSSGNVGIGTVTPDSRLDVTGGDITVNTSASGFMNFKYGSLGSETSKGTITTDGIDLRINATADLIFQPTGNVGIGTITPDEKLEVNGNILIDKGDNGNISIKNGSQNVAQLGDLGGGTDGQLALYDNSGAVKLVLNGQANSYLDGGNVGIGTTSPTDTLDVDGGIRLSTSGRIQGRSYPYTTNIGSGANATTTNITAGSTDKSEISLVGGDVGDRIEFKTNSTERMRIDASGNVGIGTTSPFTNLEVASSGVDSIIRLYAGGGTANIRTWEMRAVGVAGEGLLFRQVNDANNSYTNRMIIDTDGNVGIGTITPAEKLHISTGHLRLDTGYSVQWSDSHERIEQSDGHLEFFVNNTESMTLDTNGIGIGTTSPTAKITLADHTTAAGGIKFRTAASSVSLWSSGSGNLNTDKSFNVGSRLRVVGGNAAADPDIGFSGASSGTGFSRASNDITFITSATERMRINSSGKVLVNGAHDNGGKADFAVDGGTQISLYDGQVQMGGADMNWNSKFVYDGQTNIAAWDNNIKIFIQGSNTGSASARDIYFCPQTSGTGAATERMRITGAGNVGIGTSSPSAKLDVSVTSGAAWMSLINGSETAFRLTTYNNGTSNGSNAYAFKHGLYYNTTENAAVTFYRGGGSTGGFLTFTTNAGSERMRITSAGNVGIGTTSPDSITSGSGTLTVNGTSSTISGGFSYKVQGTTKAYSYVESNFFRHQAQTGVGFEWFASGATRMRMLSNGNVGIGNNNPAAALDIYGTIKLNSNGTVGWGNGSNSGFLTWDTSGYNRAIVKGQSGYALHLGSNNNNERLVIDTSGNVGIGVTSPSAKLEVIGTGTQLGSTGYYINSSFKGSSNVGVFLGHNNTNNGNGMVAGINKLAFLTYGTSWGERMVIDHNGNVGIGDTSSGAKLEIHQAQVTTQFDRDCFLRLHPTATTNSGGFTNIMFGTSPVNNFGVAIGGVRAGTDGTPSFSIRMLNDSITGTEVLNITNSGQVSTTNTIFARKDDGTTYNTANIRLDSFGGSSSTVGIGFHISGQVGKYLRMNSSGVLAWEGSTVWHAGNDGSGTGLDADLLDGVHLNQLDHAEGFKTYSGISASSAQARRHHIGRLYGCPAHWDSNWQNIELNVTSESYESANLRFAIMGDYVGANNQANMLKLYLKEAHGPLVKNFRFVLGTPVDAGWDHSGQNTYYVDLYAEAKSYAQYKINIKTYGHPIYSTNPTSGGAYTVFYNTPTVTNISTFADEAHSTSKHLHHNIWNSGNMGTGSGLDADLLDGVHGSSFLRSDTADTASGVISFTGGHGAINITNSSILSSATSNWTGNPGGAGKIQYHSNRWYMVSDSSSNRIVQFRRNSDDVSYIANNGDFVGNVTGALTGNASTATSAIKLAGFSQQTEHDLIRAGNANGLYMKARWDGATSNRFWDMGYVDGNGTFYSGLKVINNGDITYKGNEMWHAGNDGSGSGLDADLLDNIDSSRFIYGDNATGTTSISGSAFNPTGSLKSGFYRVAGTSSTIPNATSVNFALHTSYDTVGNKAGFDLAVNDSTSSKIYFRPSTGGGRGSWQTIWTDSSDGSGSGLDADLLDGLDLHTGRNNEANKVVRTQGNGYLNTGWINTTSGDIGSAIPSRIYTNNNGSGDAYVRYADLSSFRSLMNVSAKASYQGREQSTTDSNYWVGTMGWGSTDFDTLFNYGSGHIESWSNPTNAPNSTETSHWTGHQSMHYTNGTNHYGHQFVVGAGNPAYCYLRGRWGGSSTSWAKMWNSANDGSGSGLDADLLDGNHASAFAVASHNHDDRYYTETETNQFLNLKANLASPALTGTPTAPTPSLSDNNTNIATTEYVKGQGYVTTDTNTTYSAGTALTLSGTTFNHSDTSSQASVTNSTGSYIQSISLDGQGHVTAITSSSETTYSAGRGLDLSGTQFLLETDLRDSISYIGYDSNDYIHWSNNSYCRTVVAGSERLRVKTDGIDVSGVVVANAIRTKAASTSYSLITRDTGASNYVLYVQSPQSGGTQKIATFGYGSANAGQATEVFRIARGNINVYSANLTVGGTITGTSKNFSIPHPTKEGKRLVHSCIEGPEVAVYFRGRSQSNTIEMPDYWGGLVDLDSMTVELTAIGPNQDLYVEDIADDGEVTVGSNTETALNYFYVVYGERKDIDKLEVEIDDTGEFEGGDGNSEEFE